MARVAIPVETFFLEAETHGTLQARIQQMVASGILSGRLGPDEKLPSSRKLAKHLGVSRITVTLAYAELVANDYLIARGRSGFYVSQSAPRPPPELKRQGEPVDAVDWGRAIGQRFSNPRGLRKPKDWSAFKYPFIYGQTDASLFDHSNWRLCAVRALGAKDFQSLTADQYDSDDQSLVTFIARHTLPRRGIAAGPDEILVTLGAQNALWLAAQVLLTQRRKAVIESPCYPGLRDMLAQTRCSLEELTVDKDGLPPEDLPQDIDVIFTTPSHQCPTNATMPLARRKALLDHARAAEAMIVEDDYEFEMSYLRPPSPALKSLDRDGRVIYVGSLSKSLFPGLRLGYLVGSEPFIREARALRAMVLRHPPGHLQRTAAYFLSLGHYDAMLNRLQTAFAKRREVMEREIKQHGLDIAGLGAFGGSSFWMRAPSEVDTGELARRLAQKGVLIEPGEAFFSEETTRADNYRLAYSSIPVERIPDGIRLIAEEIKSMS